MNIKKFLKFGLIISIVALFLFKAIDSTRMRITAVFKELEPFTNLNVYYKGFKIGRAVKIVPSKDFLTTRVTIALNSWNYKLPNNIKVKVQKSHKDSDVDYMEIIYPSSPSITHIKYGDKIEGEISHDWNDLINNVTEGGGFDELRGNANSLLGSANEAAKAITETLNSFNSILTDIRPQVRQASNELVETCQNLNRMSVKLERSIDDKSITNSFSYIQNTTKNVETTTQIINSKTLPALNVTICSLKSLLDNINVIVRGIGQTLQKRMGGVRLIFGKPIS